MDKGKWNEWARKIISALKKYKYAALVLVIGLALMLIPFGSEKKQTKQQQTPSEPAAAEQQDYAQEMEARLTAGLSEEDVEHLKHCLDQMLQNLDVTIAEDTRCCCKPKQ